MRIHCAECHILGQNATSVLACPDCPCGRLLSKVTVVCGRIYSGCSVSGEWAVFQDWMPCRWAYAEAGWSRIASLAPTVLQCAEEGDSIAFKIVTSAAHEALEAVVTVATKTKLKGQRFKLVLSGAHTPFHECSNVKSQPGRNAACAKCCLCYAEMCNVSIRGVCQEFPSPFAG